MRPPDPQIEKGAAANDAPQAPNPSLAKARQPSYGRAPQSASHLVVYRLDSKDTPEPELWEEAYEARVSLLAQECAETERENEYLRSRLAMATDELELRRKLCRCRRWTK